MVLAGAVRKEKIKDNMDTLGHILEKMLLVEERCFSHLFSPSLYVEV